MELRKLMRKIKSEDTFGHVFYKEVLQYTDVLIPKESDWKDVPIVEHDIQEALIELRRTWVLCSPTSQETHSAVMALLKFISNESNKHSLRDDVSPQAVDKFAGH